MILRTFSSLFLWASIAGIVYGMDEIGAMWVLNLCATLTLFEIYLIHFRIQHGLEAVVLHAFAIGIVEQFFLHLILDLLGKAGQDFIQRRFAFAEAGQVGLFLELLGHLTKSHIHILDR